MVDFGDPCSALGTLLGFVALLFKDGVESFDASDVHVLLCPFDRSALPVLVLLAVVKLVVLFQYEFFIHNRFNVLSLCKLAWDLSNRCYMYNDQSGLLP